VLPAIRYKWTHPALTSQPQLSILDLPIPYGWEAELSNKDVKFDVYIILMIICWAFLQISNNSMENFVLNFRPYRTLVYCMAVWPCEGTAWRGWRSIRKTFSNCSAPYVEFCTRKRCSSGPRHCRCRRWSAEASFWRKFAFYPRYLHIGVRTAAENEK